MRKRFYMSKFTVRLTVFLFVFLFPSIFFAQNAALVLSGSVISQNDKSKLSGAKISIKKNGSNFENVVTDAKGKFLVRLPPDGKFMLEFTYPEYVVKRISFNTTNVPPEFWAEGDFEFPFDMTLFKQVEGLDVSILNQPLAEVAIDPTTGNFNYDKEYTKSVKERIEKLQADLEQLEKDYTLKMAAGDKAVSQQNFSGAKVLFEAALAFKPGDAAAKTKLDDVQKKYDAQLAEKNKEKTYTQAIEAAETALHNGDLKSAETEFMKAFDAKPGDVYARDQIKDVRDKMAASAKAEQIYMTSIAKADAALAVKDYLTAKAEYTKATEAKPADKYAKDQLAHVGDLLLADAKRESEYIKAIERGESSKEAKDYEAAKAAFEQASQIKSEEKYPKDQITEINTLIAEIALKSKNYDDAIKRADAAFKQNDFEVAKKAYQEAIDINPMQQYPKDQIVAITAKLEEMKLKEAQYAELIKDADMRYTSKDFIAAKSEYTKALEIKPNEAHPKARIAEIAALLEKEAKIEEEYKSAISNADNAFKANDFQSAKFEYAAANKLKPDEKYPVDQLKIVDAKLAEAALAEENYANAIKEGDAKFKLGEMEAAKTSYTAALTLKPKESYPKEQIALIDKNILELANLNKEYDAKITEADKQFKAGELATAKSGYQQALDLKPTETYPKDQIASITATLAEKEKKDADYKKFIADADASFEKKEYEKAKSAYTSAGGMKPEETYPKEKIAAIDQLLGEMANKQKLYDEAITKADAAFNGNKLAEALPLYQNAAGIKEDEKYPIAQITLIESKLEELKKKEESYTAAITAGDKAEKGGDLELALTEFKNASSIKPEESYPKEKITAISSLIAQNKEKDAAYNEAIALADEAKKSESYDIAIAQYKKASQVKPEEAYPKAQLKEVEALKLASLEAIAIAKKKDDDYKTLIAAADGMFDSKKYEESKKKYQEALDIKPTEEYPKTRIGEIDKTMAGLMAEKERDEKYATSITAADKAFKEKNWSSAKSSYNEALSVKPGETYPSDQLVAIETAIAEAAAMASQQAKDENYAAFIAKADQAFKSKDWENAKNNYREAKSVKPEESYPDEQIKSIDAAILAAASLAEKEAAEAAAKERNEKYAAFLAAGDEAFKSEDWEPAKNNYRQAKGVKPEETYPDEQLKAIDAAIALKSSLAEKQAAEAAAKERDEKYKSFLSAADQAFKSKDWENAKNNYQQAKSVKPAETYPDEQLKAIAAEIAEASSVAEKEAAEAAAKEKDLKYNGFIASADKSFKEKDWENAKSNYIQAQKVKPLETYPAEQLKAIDEAIAAASSMAAKEAAEAEAKKKEAEYLNLISQADKAFTKKSWDEARSAYQSASTVKPAENYPKDQLKLIDAESKASEAQEQDRKYKESIALADKAFKSKNWNDAISAYESALAIKPTEQYPKDQISLVNEKLKEDQSLALQNKKEQDYLQAIGDADQLFNTEQWQPAKSRYQEALNMKPEEVYPKQKIGEIEDKLGKLASSAKKDEEYQNLIKQADAAFSEKNYTSSKESYNKALAVKNESYPSNKIKEIDAILNAEKMKSNSAKDAELAKQKQYDKFIYDGDKNFGSENYAAAKGHYQSALSVKPGEGYPQKKINEINDLLSKQELAVKPAPAVKKSSGMSEAEIAAMMAKWQQERDQSKTDRMDQYKSDLMETDQERIENADTKRLETTENIVNLEKEIAESNKSGMNRNLEEAKLIEEVKSDNEKFNENLSEDSEQKRSKYYTEIEKTEQGQKELREEGNELYQVNTELNTTLKMELIQVEKERNKKAHDGLLVAHQDIVEQEEDWRNFNDERKDAHMKDVERIQKENKMVASTLTTWSDESHESRLDAYENIKQQEEEIIDFQANNSESYAENTRIYNQTVEDQAEYNKSKRSESSSKRKQAYGDIAEYQKEVSELTLERNNRYDENNKEIRSNNQSVLDQEAEYSADAAERRSQFNRDFYTGEKKPRYPEIAREHSQGITEESYEEGDSYVVKRVVVKDEGINEYKKIFYKWGGVFYKKNDTDITEAIWNAETQ